MRNVSQKVCIILQGKQYQDRQKVEKIMDDRSRKGSAEFDGSVDVRQRNKNIGYGGADVGAHDDGNGVGDRQGIAAHEADDNRRGRGRALDDGRGQDTDEQAYKWIGCAGDQRLSEAFPEQLHGASHQIDAEQKDVERSKKKKNLEECMK